MIKELKDLSYEDKLRELGVFGLEESPGRSCSTFWYLKAATRNVERGIFKGVFDSMRRMALS